MMPQAVSAGRPKPERTMNVRKAQNGYVVQMGIPFKVAIPETQQSPYSHDHWWDTEHQEHVFSNVDDMIGFVRREMMKSDEDTETKT